MLERALVTGSKGFVGSPLSRELGNQGFKVEGFDLANNQDILDRSLVSESVGRNDLVFHFAGLLGTNELQDKALEATVINVVGALNVLDAARSHGARVVLASKPNPWLNTYTITKEAAEKFALMYSQDHNVDVRVARFFNIYGPGQKIKGVRKAVPTFIMNALQNEPLEIFGSGEQTGDFIYLDDAVHAIVLLGQMAGLKGEVVEVGTGLETSVNFLAETVVELIGSRSKIEHIPMRSGENPDTRLAADTTKVVDVLGFRPSIGLAEGLRETIDWYKRKYFPERQPLISVA